MVRSKFVGLFVGVMAVFAVAAGSLFAATTGPTVPATAPVLSGTVTAIEGSTIKLDVKGTTITVDASGAKIISITTPQGAAPQVSTLDISDIQVGEKLKVRGTQSGNTMTADSIVDKGMAPAGQNGPQGRPGDELGALGVGGVNVGASLAKCTNDCQSVEKKCIAEIENGLRKVCDQKQVDCQAGCDAKNLNDATLTRQCYSQCHSQVSMPCYNEVTAKESACTTTKDQCIGQCEKDAKKLGKPGQQVQPKTNLVQPKKPSQMPQQGNQPQGQQPPAMNEAAKAAMAANDFNAWVKAMSPMPEGLKKVTKDNFPTFVKAYNYQTQAKELMDKANELLKSIGVPNPQQQGQQPQGMQGQPNQFQQMPPPPMNSMPE